MSTSRSLTLSYSHTSHTSQLYLAHIAYLAPRSRKATCWGGFYYLENLLCKKKKNVWYNLGTNPFDFNPQFEFLRQILIIQIFSHSFLRSFDEVHLPVCFLSWTFCLSNCFAWIVSPCRFLELISYRFHREFHRGFHRNLIRNLVMKSVPDFVKEVALRDLNKSLLISLDLVVKKYFESSTWAGSNFLPTHYIWNVTSIAWRIQLDDFQDHATILQSSSTRGILLCVFFGFFLAEPVRRWICGVYHPIFIPQLK